MASNRFNLFMGDEYRWTQQPDAWDRDLDSTEVTRRVIEALEESPPQDANELVIVIRPASLAHVPGVTGEVP